ncbi:MAG: hypothetical protein ACRD5H_13590, partial [Nitrososphaerales archaeon]
CIYMHHKSVVAPAFLVCQDERSLVYTCNEAWMIRVELRIYQQCTRLIEIRKEKGKSHVRFLDGPAFKRSLFAGNWEGKWIVTTM